MTDILDKIKDKVADEKLKKAEGTGALSKLFSWLSGHTLLVLIVFLINDKLYIPLLIFIIFGFTRFALWIGFAGITYFIYSQYWIGVFLISAYTIFSFISGVAGHQHIKKNLFNGKTNISPFEGMNDLPILYSLQLIVFGFAVFCSGWLKVVLWVFYSLLTLFIISRVYIRLKSKWCSIYYPLSIRYSHFIGHELAISHRNGNKTNIENAVRELTRNVYPNFDDEKLDDFMHKINYKLINFSDRNDLIAYCKRLYKNQDEEVYVKTFDQIQIKLMKEGSRKLPFFFYSEVIERDFGKDERLKFMMEVFNGKVF